MYASLAAAACTRPNPAYYPVVNTGDRSDGGDAGVELAPPVDLPPGPEPVTDGPPSTDGASEPALAGEGGGEVVVPPPVDGPVADGGSEGPALSDARADLAPDVTVNPPLDPDLLVWWRFDEGSGTSSLDHTGRGHQANLRNGVTWETGRAGAGRAVRLDGGSQHIVATVPSKALLPRVNGDKTIMLWVNPDQRDHASLQTLVSLSDDSDSFGIQVGTREGDAACWLWGDSASQTILRSSEPPAGWYHIAYTFTAGRHRLYVNGVQVMDGSTRAADNSPAHRIFVGTFSLTSFTDEMYDGALDDVRIYRRALTVEEINAARLQP